MVINLTKMIMAQTVSDEVLTRWRKLGFLRGLKQDSIIEKRCAQTMENAARFFLVDENYEKWGQLDTVMFALIRMIIAKKNRVNRVLTAEEIINEISQITISEALEKGVPKTFKGKHAEQYRCLQEFCKFEGILNEKVIDILSKSREHDYILFQKVTGIDTSMAFCFLISEPLKARLKHKKTTANF